MGGIFKAYTICLQLLNVLCSFQQKGAGYTPAYNLCDFTSYLMWRIYTYSGMLSLILDPLHFSGREHFGIIYVSLGV